MFRSQQLQRPALKWIQKRYCSDYGPKVQGITYTLQRNSPLVLSSVSTLALINAGLAEHKGRNRLVWLGLSFLAGPFATAYIVFAPAPNAYIQPPPIRYQ